MGLFDLFKTPPTPTSAAEKLFKDALDLTVTESDNALAKFLNVEIHLFVKERTLLKMAQTLAAIGFINSQKPHPNMYEMGRIVENQFRRHLNSIPGMSEQQSMQTFSKANQDYPLDMPETLASRMFKNMTQGKPSPDFATKKTRLTEYIKSQMNAILLQTEEFAEKLRKQWAT
jgi:hypothetical protein